MKKSRPVHLHIEELVLHGFQPGDRHPVAEAVQRELSRLFAENGAAALAQRPAGIDRIDGGAFRVQAGRKPQSTGERVARAIYGGLRK
jgi:hypothetical protein